jgi:hypothetical protein
MLRDSLLFASLPDALLERLARDLGNKLRPTTEMVAALS